MDNRTGFRPVAERRAGGHAFYAQQARRALGLEPEGVIAQLRAPVFHFLLGAAVAGVAVLAQPQRVGLPLGIAIDVLLALLATLALTAYDRLSPPEARPGLAGGALPTAALLAEAVVLAGAADMREWLPAVVVAAVVIAVAPHLSALRIAGRDDAWLRVARDAAGVAVMGPVLIAAGSPALGPVRGVMLALASFLTAIDALHTDRAGPRRMVVAAVLVAMAVSGSLAPAAHAGQAPGAAMLLVLWYGLRGMAAAACAPRVARGALVEYAVFVGVAGAMLGLSARH